MQPNYGMQATPVNFVPFHQRARRRPRLHPTTAPVEGQGELGL